MNKSKEIVLRQSRTGLKVFELINALEQMPPDATIEIAVSQYNKAYPHYLYLTTHFGEPCELKNESVRIFSSLPESETDYSILSTRKK